MLNQLKTIALLGGLSTLLIGIGGMLGQGWFYGAIVMALVMNVGAYFFSDKMVLAMYRAQPVGPNDSPRLYAMVEDLAKRAQIPTPRLYLIRAPYANAFATGRNPQNGVVAVTEGILHLLDERELRGVIAHELAHIKNRDILISTIAAVIVGAISMIASILQWGMIFGSNRDDEESSPLANLAMLIVAPIAATLLQLAISRSREYYADEAGAQISGDPEALARALEKLERGAELIPANAQPATASLFIVNPFGSLGGLVRLFSTHPSTAERVRRLRSFKTTPATVG